MSDRTLADLLSRRGWLRAGEVVTLVAAIAAELAALHEGGRAYGPLVAGRVVFVDEGRPSLVQPAAGSGSAAADLRALVALMRECLGGDASAPAALLAAVESSKSAGELGRAVLASVPAEPIDFTVAVETETVATPGHGRRALIAVAVLIVAVVAAVVAGVSSAPRAADGLALPSMSHPSQYASASTTPPIAAKGRPGWRRVVEQLEQRRVSALTTRDASLLADVYTRSARAARVDRATIHALVRRGLTPVDFSATVGRVSLLSRATRHVELRVADALSAYQLVDEVGNVVGRLPSRPPRVFVWTLQRSDATWLIRAIRVRR